MPLLGGKVALSPVPLAAGSSYGRGTCLHRTSFPVPKRRSPTPVRLNPKDSGAPKGNRFGAPILVSAQGLPFRSVAVEDWTVRPLEPITRGSGPALVSTLIWSAAGTPPKSGRRHYRLRSLLGARFVCLLPLRKGAGGVIPECIMVVFESGVPDGATKVRKSRQVLAVAG